MSTATVTDADLVTRAAAGDRSAYTALYQRHVDTVHDHVARWSRDSALAADATQEAFVALLAHLGSIRDGQAVLAWLLRTARNRAIDQLRKLQHERTTAPTSEIGIPTALMTAVDEDPRLAPAVAAERSEAATLVWEVAAGLDERTFTVMDLTVRAGLSGPELAEVMGTTPANANVLVHRMRERLRSLFGAVLLLRTGRSGCDELTALTDGMDEPLSLEDARRVHAHADGCADCEPRRRRAIAPMQAYAAFAQVRTPVEVHKAIQDAAEAHFAPPPSGPSLAVRGAVVGAVLLALMAAVTLLRPEVTPEGVPVATGVPIELEADPDSEPAPEPSVIPADDLPGLDLSELPIASPSPEPSPSASPSPSPSPSPTPSPSPSAEPTPFAVTIDAPTDATSVAAVSEDDTGAAIAVIDVAATTVGGSGQSTVVWLSDLAPDLVLLEGPTGSIRLGLAEECTDTTHVLTARAEDSTTEEVAQDAVTVVVTHTCPPPLEISILEPAGGTEVTTDHADEQGRPAAFVSVVAEAPGDPGDGSWTYAWTTDVDPSVTLATGARTRVELWTDLTCTPTSHTVTVTVTDTTTGATGSDRVVVRVTCPVVREP